MNKVDEVFTARSDPRLPRKKRIATECQSVLVGAELVSKGELSCVGFQRGVKLCWYPKGSMYYVFMRFVD